MNKYLELLNVSQEDSIVQEILAQAKELKTPIIQPDGLAKIIDLIKTTGKRRVLEIGSAIGFSAIMMAKYADCEVLSIERDLDSHQRARDNIRKAGLESRIQLILADALEYQLDEDYQCDLLFIDAAKGQYVKFFDKFTKHLTEGGIVIADNLMFHGLVEDDNLIETKNQRKLVEKIKRFNEYILNHPEYDTKILKIGDGLSISIKK